MSFWNGISRAFFGNGCLSCHRSGVPLDPWLCADCKSELGRLAKSPKRPRPDVLSLYAMTPLTKSLVHGLKYGNMPGLAGYLVNRALRESETLEILCGWGRRLAFIPVPLHPARMRERGYNQAERLAFALASRTGGVVVEPLFRKTFRTSQTTLSRTGRANNVAGAFGWKRRFRFPDGCVPVIVDDVFTTGATTAACLYALEKENLDGMAKICTLLCEESAKARTDFVADSSTEWLV
jgi:ComF family protein